MGGLGPKNVKNMATLKMCLFLERERDLWPRGQSGAALGAYLGGLGPLLEPVLAVLGRSWVLCWRSWAALGAYLRDLGASVGGLGPLLGSMLAVLGLCWRSWGALGRKVAQTPAGTGVPKESRGGSSPPAEATFRPTDFYT